MGRFTLDLSDQCHATHQSRDRFRFVSIGLLAGTLIVCLAQVGLSIYVAGNV